MEVKQITPEEIQTVKSIRQERAEIVNQFGEIEVIIQEYEMIKQELKDKLSSLKKREIAIGKELQGKYGEGTINIERGEFISNS